MVADLLLGSPITQRTTVELLVNNLTDENYYEKRGYSLSGRSYQVRLTASF
jgi:vitamin B12 transporter